MSLLLPLILTIVIEVLVLTALRECRRKVLLACVLMNVLTNVPLNAYVQYVDNSAMTICVGELLVFLIEAVCYRLVANDWRTAMTYSSLCNAVSYFTGVLIFGIFVILI